jgi:uncharacterized NAD-dependent epimerase/dehydratase family protein
MARASCDASLPSRARAFAAKTGRHIHDVRGSDTNLAVGTGIRRSVRRLLTVGTDSALGEKQPGLAIAKAITGRDLQVDFRPIGQTGILISRRDVVANHDADEIEPSESRQA